MHICEIRRILTLLPVGGEGRRAQRRRGGGPTLARSKRKSPHPARTFRSSPPSPPTGGRVRARIFPLQTTRAAPCASPSGAAAADPRPAYCICTGPDGKQEQPEWPPTGGPDEFCATNPRNDGER